MWSALSSANFSGFLVCFSLLFLTWIHMQSFLCISPLFKFWLEHPKLDQNPKFTSQARRWASPPLSYAEPSPRTPLFIFWFVYSGARGGRGGDFNWSLSRGVSLKPSKPVTLFETKLLIFLPCPRQETIFFDPDSFRFAFRIRYFFAVISWNWIVWEKPLVPQM